MPSLIGGVIPQKYPELRAVPADEGGVDPTPVSFGLPKDEADLKASINAFLAEKTADGTIDELKERFLTVKAILG